MLQVLLALEIIIAIALVAVILLQRSEGGALGIGGGAGIGGLMSARGAANLLTRLTAILAAAFIGVSLLLANLTGQRDDGSSVFDNPELTRPLADDLPALEEEFPALDDDSGLPAIPEQDDNGDTPPEE